MADSLHSVHDQIQDDLLQLNGISRHQWRQIAGRMYIQNNTVRLDRSRRDCRYLLNKLVEIYCCPCGWIALEHRPNALDDRIGTMALVDNDLQRTANLVDFG